MNRSTISNHAFPFHVAFLSDGSVHVGTASFKRGVAILPFSLRSVDLAGWTANRTEGSDIVSFSDGTSIVSAAYDPTSRHWSITSQFVEEPLHEAESATKATFVRDAAPNPQLARVLDIRSRRDFRRIVLPYDQAGEIHLSKNNSVVFYSNGDAKLGTHCFAANEQIVEHPLGNAIANRKAGYRELITLTLDGGANRYFGFEGDHWYEWLRCRPMSRARVGLRTASRRLSKVVESTLPQTVIVSLSGLTYCLKVFCLYIAAFVVVPPVLLFAARSVFWVVNIVIGSDNDSFP